MKRGVQKERNKKVSVNVNLAVGNIFGQCSSFLALATNLTPGNLWYTCTTNEQEETYVTLMMGKTRVGKKQAPLFPLGPTSTEVKVSIRRVSMKLTALNRNRPFQWTSQPLHTNQLNPLKKKIYN